ncbi:hypothetical protein DESA109040_02720 [Deinococcus saxicola]
MSRRKSLTNGSKSGSNLFVSKTLAAEKWEFTSVLLKRSRPRSSGLYLESHAGERSTPQRLGIKLSP